MKFLKLIVLVAMLALPARADDATCSIVQLASLDLLPIGPLNSVQAELNGHTMNLVVDTGGAISMLKASAAARLNVPIKYSQSVTLRDVYGNPMNAYVVVSDVNLGRLKGTDLNFMIMPDGMASRFMDGLLAPDILSAFDIEFDFAKRKLNFFSPKHCAGQVVYWTNEPYAAIPARLDSTRHIFITLELDGQKIESYVDTGASDSFMPIKLARRLYKWRKDPPELISRTDTVNNTRITTYFYPFKSLSFEGVSVSNPQIIIGDEIMKGEGNLVLGMNILSRLHLYIDYKERKLYATARDAQLPAGMSFAPSLSFVAPQAPKWPEPLQP